MKKQRRVFDTTFKLEVVKLIKEQGVSVSQVCTDMSIGETAVRRCGHYWASPDILATPS